ncbi:AAA domain-containing protein [Frondihabitans australicus]|uniref:AAA domain-containing protein n=1 Tax=Frondihabitans australicus TaxID=386892 RepID=A0A495IFG0_9MICO|nr:AAA domain-containing protein [Frondihabitans australicus]
MLINGAPGSGKTTLARLLGPELGRTVLSKDAVKEALADAVAARLPTRELGALASDAMWRLAALVDGPVVVESFWAADRDEAFLAEGLRIAGITSGVEVYCEAPLPMMRARFVDRERHAAHDDALRLDEWEHLAAVARPLSGFPVLRVDTSAPVDVAAVAVAVRETLG